MSENVLTLDAIKEVVTPLERKYGWTAQGTDEGEFILSITDGSHTASGVVTSTDEIEELVKKLESEVDGHSYKVLG